MSKFSNQSYKDFIKFVEFMGCVLHRVSGDHFIFQKEGLSRPLVIPKYDPLPEFIVRNNIRVLGLSPKQYKAKLDEMKKKKKSSL